LWLAHMAGSTGSEARLNALLRISDEVIDRFKKLSQKPK
jgi:hypothetical protein